MIVIRREQLSAFAPGMEAAFADRLALLLREQFEEAREAPHDELRADVARMAGRARVYALTTEREAAGYVIAAFLLGEEFDQEFPAAQEVLTSPVLNGADKAQWLKEWTTALLGTLGAGE